MADVLNNSLDSRTTLDIDLLKEDYAHIRQLKISNGKAAICVNHNTDKYDLVVFDLQTGQQIKNIPLVTSAVFSADGNRIIAARDQHQENIAVIDSASLEILSEITISFPGLHEEVAVD